MTPRTEANRATAARLAFLRAELITSAIVGSWKLLRLDDLLAAVDKARLGPFWTEAANLMPLRSAWLDAAA